MLEETQSRKFFFFLLDFFKCFVHGFISVLGTKFYRTVVLWIKLVHKVLNLHLEMNHVLLEGDDQLPISFKFLDLKIVLSIVELNWVTLNFEPFIINPVFFSLECFCGDVSCKG